MGAEGFFHVFLSLVPVVLFRFVVSVIVYGLFWNAGLFASSLVTRVGRARHMDADLAELLARIASISLQVIGAITALGTLGIDITALVAGLGLTGFALGFAFKDIISNALSGILLILYKPVRRGDRIKFTDLTGTVVHIDLRYTVLDSAGKTIYLPNSALFANPITVEERAPPDPAPPGPAPPTVLR